MYTIEDIEFLETTAPTKEGWYYVTFFQYNKEKSSDPDYFKDWIEVKNKKWVYADYKNKAYVCFIHKKRIGNIL